MIYDKNSELLFLEPKLENSAAAQCFDTPWLPPHTLRISKRAKRFHLKLSPDAGLEIIIPTGFGFFEIPILLEKNRIWIEKHYKRMQPFLRAGHEEEIPDQIFLTAIDKAWSLHFIATETKNLSMHCDQENQLFLTGHVHNKKMIQHHLRLWLKNQAAHYLLPWLKRLSDTVQLIFNEAKICHAQSLWGSCSIKKNISLNCRLLFLSAELVEYVILHELCHTIHFNHSKKFWDLLKQLNPNCLALRKELRYANRHLPMWA